MCLRQGDYLPKDYLNRLLTKNYITQMEILLVSFLVDVIFHTNPGLLLLKMFNNTLLQQNEREETQLQEHQHPSLFLLEFHHSSPPLCKSHKYSEIDKKIQTCETLLHQGLYIFLK